MNGSKGGMPTYLLARLRDGNLWGYPNGKFIVEDDGIFSPTNVVWMLNKELCGRGAKHTYIKGPKFTEDIPKNQYRMVTRIIVEGKPFYI